MSHTEYMRQLAVAALVGEPGTATEVAERMRLLAESHGHSPSILRQINAQSASGHLRALQLAGAVHAQRTKRSLRHGREEPVYGLADDYDGPRAMPMEPDDKDEDDPLRGLSRSQVVALLNANELFAELAAKQLQQIHEVSGRARRILEENGLL